MFKQLGERNCEAAGQRELIDLRSESAVTVPPGKREQRKAITRAELLIAARELFGERGLYESSVEDLTRRAGIAKGTLYLYFRNKEELIQAVLREGFESLHRRMIEEVGQEAKLGQVMERIALAHLGFLAQNPDLLRIFHQARGMLKFNRREWLPLRGSLQTHLDRVAELLETSPEGGRLTPAERRGLALFFFGAVSGISSIYATAEGASLRSDMRRTLSRALAVAAAEIHSVRQRRPPGMPPPAVSRNPTPPRRRLR
jgi:AcrR family transcriptional regulator